MTAMTATEAPPLCRQRIMSSALARVFATSFGALTAFYLLVSVVPLYASSVGAGDVGAGLSTGALMFATVGAELLTPRLVARFGSRGMLAVGLVLLGAPALALPMASDMGTILVISVVRGLGFAIVMVVTGALVPVLVPVERRGEGLGLYGLVVGIPGIVALPLGVWLAGHLGYPVVFVAGAAASLLAVAFVPALPAREPRHEEPVGVADGLRDRALMRPALVFSATSMAAGVVVGFVPLAVAGGSLAAMALLMQVAAATLTRWLAGRVVDRHGAARLLVPGLAVTAVGVFALVVPSSPVAVLIGTLLFGAGFGVTQTATMSMMLARVSPSGYGTVSALWNLGYDGGWGVGAAACGFIAAQAGYPVAFGLTAVIVLIATVPARRDRAVR
jgi:predicted MFS family arabinose efflux permease